MLLFCSPGKTTTQTLRRVLPCMKTPQLEVLSAKYQYVSIQYSIEFQIDQYVIIQSNVIRTSPLFKSGINIVIVFETRS